MSNVSELNSKPISRTSLTFKDKKYRDQYLVQGDDKRKSILNVLYNDSGIVMPYSPDINITTTSTYAQADITHSNYDYHTFVKSSISTITVDVKLVSDTLENADRTLAIIHLLRALSKMYYGANDPNAGTPPPIMLLSAYGKYMINGMPVALRSFYMQLSSDNDYVHTSFDTQVPIEFNVQLDLVHMPNPIKIRDEFTMDKFIDGSLVERGYF